MNILSWCVLKSAIQSFDNNFFLPNCTKVRPVHRAQQRWPTSSGGCWAARWRWCTAMRRTAGASPTGWPRGAWPAAPCSWPAWSAWARPAARSQSEDHKSTKGIDKANHTAQSPQKFQFRDADDRAVHMGRVFFPQRWQLSSGVRLANNQSGHRGGLKIKKSQEKRVFFDALGRWVNLQGFGKPFP